MSNKPEQTRCSLLGPCLEPSRATHLTGRILSLRVPNPSNPLRDAFRISLGQGECILSGNYWVILDADFPQRVQSFYWREKTKRLPGKKTVPSLKLLLDDHRAPHPLRSF